MSRRLILGLNQYTHSASACLLDERGEVLGALSKERLTRRKHDGGDTAVVVEALLERCDAQLSDLCLVVANNHLFRIRPFEAQLEFACALHQQPPSALRDSNLFPGIDKHEVSHHLAHAWSALSLAPFDRGLILVADGMGNTRADVEKQSVGSEMGPYTSDVDLNKASGFAEYPEQARAHRTEREAETLYRFDGLDIERVHKRWIEERTPVFLYNYGFENMESLGALYSRVSSQIFGNWNACGKVMGLAPWREQWSEDLPGPFLTGPLEQLQVQWQRLRELADPARWTAVAEQQDVELRAAYTASAAQIQSDLEVVLLDYLTRMRQQTGERNLCMVGGVALNSTANGRIAREAGFEQVFIPPWPGDEGVAVGCALFGHHLLHDAQPRRACFSPALGGHADEDDVAEALATWGPWLQQTLLDEAGGCPASEQQNEEWLNQASGRTTRAVELLVEGRTLGWMQGRSEFGPRALGHRSILAHPGDAAMVSKINQAIKKREGFRPFAPSVLAEAADQWFENVTPSPYMSLTVQVRPERREQLGAVMHVDGSARLQTLEAEAHPLYHQLLRQFGEQTGIPMVLNTSFNVKGEPIVETASDAFRHFLDSELDDLILEGTHYRKREFPDQAAWSSVSPTAMTNFTAQVVSGADGETHTIAIMAYGDNFEVSQLELGVLEACDASMPVSELADEFSREFDVDTSLTVAALQRLYALRLVHFGD